LAGIANLSPGTALRAEGGRVWETAYAGSGIPKSSGPSVGESPGDLAAAVASTLRQIMQELVRQFTRPFFSRIYNGSRGAWLQPCLLPGHRLSPFWDSRLLKLLLRAPLEDLRDYGFYNRLYRDHFPELTDIPTNSPLAGRADACLSEVVEGSEPKDVVSLKYGAALDEYRKDPATWARGIYSDGLRQSVEDPRAEFVAPFVDLEA